MNFAHCLYGLAALRQPYMLDAKAQIIQRSNFINVLFVDIQMHKVVMLDERV